VGIYHLLCERSHLLMISRNSRFSVHIHTQCFIFYLSTLISISQIPSSILPSSLFLPPQLSSTPCLSSSTHSFLSLTPFPLHSNSITQSVPSLCLQPFASLSRNFLASTEDCDGENQSHGGIVDDWSGDF
jgi:hypothetical protein